MNFYIIISYIVSFVLVISIVFFQRRDPIVSIAWVLFFVTFPIIAPLIFLIFGIGLKKYTKRKYQNKYEIASKNDVRLNKQLRNNYHGNSKFSDMINYFQVNAKSPLCERNEVKIFADSKEKFDSLFFDIENAKMNINILYFIIRNDEIGNRFIDLLIKKARQGVEVRLMYDGFGSLLTNKKLFEKLAKEPNAYVNEFFPVKLFSFSKINHRNHRKEVIIDGEIAYIGGMNIGDEYLGKGKPSPWRDTHLRIVGDAVFQIQKIFSFDWEFSTGEDLSKKFSQFFNSKNLSNDNVNMQIVSSGPDSDSEEIKFGMLKMINNAKKYIYIQTPYFVPDKTFATALKLACESGIDVRIMIPGKPDKKYVYHTTLSYIGDLLPSGVKVYKHNGFIHSKTIVCDDEISTIGTTNIDTRSFDLHFEINAFMYDKAVALKNKNIFFNDLAHCEELTIEKYNKRKKEHMFSYFLDGFFRMFSPIM